MERRCIQAIRRPKRDLLEVGHRLDLRLRVLDRQHVAVARLWIDPETRRDHAVRRESSDHVVDDVSRRNPQKASLYAVDIQFQSWIVEVLRNENIVDRTELLQLGGRRLRNVVGLLQVVASDLNIDRSRLSLVDHRIHQTAGLKICGHIGKVCGEFLPDLLHVGVAPDLVILFQADLDERGVHSRVGGIDRGKVGRNADVRDDHVEIFWRDHTPDVLFHLGDVVVCYLDSSSGRDLHVHHELAWVGAGEERLA